MIDSFNEDPEPGPWSALFSNQEYHFHINEDMKAAFSLVGAISIMASIFVALSIFSVPKLRAHPNIMIGFISLFEGISAYHTMIWGLNSMEFIEFFGLQNLMQYTFLIPPITSDKDACITLWTFNRVIGSGFFGLMSLGMNTCLWIDLYLTLKQPFYPAQRRLKFYLLGSFLFSAGVVSIMFFYSAGRYSIIENCSPITKDTSATIYNSIMAISLSIYIMWALFSVVYTGRMLSKPGISENIKKLFLKRHILYVVGFIGIWVITLSSAYRNLYLNHGGDKAEMLKGQRLTSLGYRKTWVIMPRGIVGEVWIGKDDNVMELSQKISLFAVLSTGILMAIIRCFEPYFIFICRRIFYMIYGKPWTIDDEQERFGKLDDTISTFLNSSLNIELVHIILKSITDDCSNQQRKSADWKEIKDNFDKFNVKEKHDYYEVEIEDPDAWAIDNFSKSKKAQPTDKKFIKITEDVEVTQLAPEIFNCIRRQDNITKEDVMKSLNPNANREMAFKAGEGSGKSGSFFFFSHDRGFIIKSMTDGEYTTFTNMFKEYSHHLMKYKNSLLARIYGIYTVKIEKLAPVHLIMMGNTVQCKFSLGINN
jgi:hypothetical protein